MVWHLVVALPDGSMSAVTVSIVVVITTTIIWVALRMINRGHASSPVTIREADQPASIEAGEVCLRGDALGKAIQHCHPATQLVLRCVSRGWREAVGHELGEYDPSSGRLWAEAVYEAHAISLLSERSLKAAEGDGDERKS